MTELEKVSNNEGEGEAARYFSHAITLRKTIMFLRQNASMQMLENVSGSNLPVIKMTDVSYIHEKLWKILLLSFSCHSAYQNLFNFKRWRQVFLDCKIFFHLISILEKLNLSHF